jgi:selenocysteine lyase/cysteine desulfurase
MPHCSNIVGVENDVSAAAALVHGVGARLIVDGVSFVPHGIPNVAALDADVYLFSLYKVYSVHQGVMVVRNGLIDDVPNQGHWFNAEIPTKRLTPAGPDHAQEAAAGAVLDYIEALYKDHGGGTPDAGLGASVAVVSAAWRDHEERVIRPLLDYVDGHDRLRLIGPVTAPAAHLHRCPTVAVDPRDREPAALARALAGRGIAAGAGDFYALRVLEAVGVDPARGVLRLSAVHYSTADEVLRAVEALDAELG